ncbi:MAG: 50S ribosomal protein L3 N(5)-glutamine methyltransferase [Gammaproteobacteria bacterium]|nr:50S ribosomal protein L3 N(5)-glutamine methyltransferase [Gammaproteobacteria bacterium]
MKETNELLTIRDFLRWATSRFNEAGLYFGHGTDNAWDEAALLILHTLHLPHHVAGKVMDSRITSSEREQLIALIERRIKERIPLSYLTHEAWFAGLSFYVDERVLIPRSPLGELIANHFEPWLGYRYVGNILDLCTGSGCIAVASAKAFPFAHVDASDISKDALAVANINLARHHVEDQVHLIESNLFENIPPKQYDIIISNPPYVDQADMDDLPAEYRHEPTLGLAAGHDGLKIVLDILRDAKNWLSPNGLLIVETGNSETALVEKLPEIPFNWLEFECGGNGVFLLTRKELDAHFTTILNA